MSRSGESMLPIPCATKARVALLARVYGALLAWRGERLARKIAGRLESQKVVQLDDSGEVGRNQHGALSPSLARNRPVFSADSPQGERAARASARIYARLRELARAGENAPVAPPLPVDVIFTSPPFVLKE